MRGCQKHLASLEQARQVPSVSGGQEMAHPALDVCSEMHVLMLRQVVERIAEVLETGAQAQDRS